MHYPNTLLFYTTKMTNTRHKRRATHYCSHWSKVPGLRGHRNYNGSTNCQLPPTATFWNMRRNHLRFGIVFIFLWSLVLLSCIQLWFRIETLSLDIKIITCIWVTHQLWNSVYLLPQTCNDSKLRLQLHSITTDPTIARNKPQQYVFPSYIFCKVKGQLVKQFTA